MSKYDNRTMNDVYLLFKSDKECQDYLRIKTTPSAKFKACDLIPEHTAGTQINGMRAENMYLLTIITNAFVEIDRNDILYNPITKKRWRVTDYTADDDGNEKGLKTRPHVQTKIELQR